MHPRCSRRSLIALPLALVGAQPLVAGTDRSLAWVSAPIGWSGRPAGEGFQIGHGFACENSWFTPGWWHTGEDWYAVDGDTGGAEVRAIAAGEVVYSGFDYPGRVVIIRHKPDLYSVYGHLQYDDVVPAGQPIETGDVLGTVLPQADRRAARQAPSHLHFEMRRFLIRDEVNGTNPGYGVNCGYQCPPGPGYWPMQAPELPVDLGWLNPTHQRFALAREEGVDGLRARPILDRVELTLRAAPDENADVTGTIAAASTPGLPLLDIDTGAPDLRETGAEAYALWFRIAPDGAGPGWVRAAFPSLRETGQDGRASAVDLPFILLPA